MRYLLGTGAGAAVVLAMLGPGAPAEESKPVDPLAATQDYLRNNPGDARTWAALGSAYVERARRTGDAAYYPKAQGALERSLHLQPSGNADALIAMGALANARHDFADAHTWGVKATREDPARSAAYGVQTDALVELGRYREAQQALTRMLDLRPDVASFTRAAHLFELRGQIAQAAHALDRAIGAAADPADLAFCHFRRGELHFNGGDVPAALREYELALAQDSGFALALAGRARAHAALGRTAEAIDEYGGAIARLPLPQFLRELGELHEAEGRIAEAQRHYALAAAQGDLRTVAAARAEWKRRQSVDVADALGWALHRAGRSAEALPYAKSADRLGGHNALHDFHRGQIERALGHPAVARTYLTRALRTNPHFSPLWASMASKALGRM